MCSVNNQPHTVILDMDNAMGLPVRDPDDGLALAMALASPELYIAGCTTSAGNCTTAEATACTLALLHAAGHTDIPVAGGSAKPLKADRKKHHVLLNLKSEGAGKRYWEEVTEEAENSTTAPREQTPEGLAKPERAEETTGPRPLPIAAHDFIIETVRRHPHQVTLIMLGGFTNLALALKKAPDIAQLIKEIVHMGGAFTPVTPDEREFVWETPDMPESAWDTLRFNTWYDPEATAVILASDIPLRLITANVTVHVFLRPNALQRITQRLQSSATRQWLDYFTRGTAPWVRWSICERELPGAHMHDPLAVACVFAPDLCRYTTMHADYYAFLKGEKWLFRTPRPHTREVLVAVDVDTDPFERLLEERLSTPPHIFADTPASRTP